MQLTIDYRKSLKPADVTWHVNTGRNKLLSHQYMCICGHFDEDWPAVQLWHHILIEAPTTYSKALFVNAGRWIFQRTQHKDVLYKQNDNEASLSPTGTEPLNSPYNIQDDMMHF